MNSKSVLLNQRGQTLIEYLIIVALVGVGSIAIMRSVGAQMNVKFAEITQSLGGRLSEKPQSVEVRKSQYSKRDLKDFARGSTNRGGRSGQGSDNDSENDNEQ